MTTSETLLTAIPIVVSIFSIVLAALALYISWDKGRVQLFAILSPVLAANNDAPVKEDSLAILIDNVGQVPVRVTAIMADGHMLHPITDEESKDNIFGKTIEPNGSIARTIPFPAPLERLGGAKKIYLTGPGNRKYKFNNLKKWVFFNKNPWKVKSQ